jgi:hypothetical protein
LGEAEREKLGVAVAFTDSEREVVLVRLPEVPVMVSVVLPVVAELLAVNVKVLVLAVLLGLNDALTPAGRPDTDKLTFPLKPFCGATVNVLVPVVPCTIVKLAGDADSVKFAVGSGDAVAETLSKVAEASTPLVPLVTSRPTYTLCAIVIVWLLPSCTQFTPSLDT